MEPYSDEFDEPKLTPNQLAACPIIVKILTDFRATDGAIVYRKNYRIIQEYSRLSGLKLKGEALRKIIGHLRRSGSPIISGGRKGYAWAIHRFEQTETIRSLRGRAMSMLAAAAGMESHRFPEDNGELTLFDQPVSTEQRSQA